MSEVNRNSPHSSSYASVIQHYKKQLIHRQHDGHSSLINGNNLAHAHHQVVEIDDNANDDDDNNVDNNLSLSNNNNHSKINSNIYEKKVRRRKRKNKNCRGQYRHETMELIKLGTNYPTLCKNNNNNIRGINNNEKSSSRTNNNEYHQNDQKEKSEYTNNKLLIQQEKTINPHQQVTHTLPQMVPERRKSKEKLEMPQNLRAPPSNCLYKSSLYPPGVAGGPGTLQHFQHHPVIQSPCSEVRLPPLPPPYPKREPQMQSARVVCPVPVRPPSPHKFYASPSHPPDVFYRPPPPPPPQHFYNNVKKRKREEISVEQRMSESFGHKCHCECGKTVNCAEKKQEEHQVPSTYFQDVVLKGVLVVGRCPVIVDGRGQLKNEQTPEIIEEIKQPHAETKEKEKALFLIKDIIAKRPQPPSSSLPSPSSVIVNRLTQPEKKPLQNKTRSVDHSVDALLSPTRRRSADFDTISISSSCSTESAGVVPPSLTAANLIADKSLIPHGKLVYLAEDNILLRYYVDTQKKMFLESVNGGAEHQSEYSLTGGGRNSEVVKLPANTKFNSKDNLSVEDYVNEMTLVERLVPRDFFHFYKFVTGYQICNHNLPVSFLTFLKVYNTDGLKELLERYVRSFSKNNNER